MNNPFESIKDIKARCLAFLENTVEHYNSTNRSQIVGHLCSYSPAHDKTEGCAIGRWLSRDNFLITSKSSVSIFSSEAERHLPNWMLEMGLLFLASVQALHDVEPNWDENGLTEQGKRMVQSIKNRYDLN